MSVVAWDGKLLAVDRQSTCSDMWTSTSKARRLSNGDVVAWTGDQEQGLVLAAWYENGCDPEKWPDFQNDKTDWTRLVVASSSGVVFFERLPVAQRSFDPYQAFGSGRDFAIGAMAMGATAKQAVLVASRFSIGCGMGVEVFALSPRRKRK